MMLALAQNRTWEETVTDAYIPERIRHAIATDSMIRLFDMEVEEATADISRVSAVVKEHCL